MARNNRKSEKNTTDAPKGSMSNNIHQNGKGSRNRTSDFRAFRDNWPLGNPRRELNRDQQLPKCWFCGGKGKTEPNKNGDAFDPCPVCHGSGHAPLPLLPLDEYGFRKCNFCGCRTNARLRRCCDKGYKADVAIGEFFRAPKPIRIERTGGQFCRHDVKFRNMDGFCTICGDPPY